jgi:hypothetical protein
MKTHSGEDDQTNIIKKSCAGMRGLERAMAMIRVPGYRAI